jgi:hypothetical protein
MKIKKQFFVTFVSFVVTSLLFALSLQLELPPYSTSFFFQR